MPFRFPERTSNRKVKRANTGNAKPGKLDVGTRPASARSSDQRVFAPTNGYVLSGSA